MYNLWDIDDIKLILKKHGFSFSKALGQNFIVDGGICPAIAREAALSKEDYVLEIGPGIGVLTAELCARAGKVVAVRIGSDISIWLDRSPTTTAFSGTSAAISFAARAWWRVPGRSSSAAAARQPGTARYAAANMRPAPTATAPRRTTARRGPKTASSASAETTVETASGAK